MKRENVPVFKLLFEMEFISNKRASTPFDSEGNDQIEICDFAGLFDKCVNATMSVVGMFTSCEPQQTRVILSWMASALNMYTTIIKANNKTTTIGEQ